MRKVFIYDTTLRDGEQMAGVNLNAGEKLRLAFHLQRLGVDCIEAGFPASSVNDFKAVQKIASQVEGVQISALARADRNDIDTALEALKDAKNKKLHIFIATSDLHMEQKLHMTREEVLERVRDAVTYGRSKCDTVLFSCEDATRSDREFLCKVYETAIECGACTVNIPDTVGYTTPEEFADTVKYVLANVKNISRSQIGVHCHNDLGLAVANTVAGLAAGASWAECTVNGIGERAGNASLEEVVMALYTRREHYGLETGINTTLIAKTSTVVSAVTGVYLAPNKAIVGRNAFLHESGIHQHGILNNPLTYEIISPATVGISTSEIVLGKHSGRHAFCDKLTELGFHVDKSVSDDAFEAFKNLSCRKKTLSDDDIKALVEEAIMDSHIKDGYELVSYQTQSGNKTRAMAMVCISKGKEIHDEAATGEGPIDAAFNAINRIVGVEYKLLNYGIKAVTGGTDALGEVRVRIADDEKEAVGKGVSTDIIESSIKAYISAINRVDLQNN